MDCPYYHQKIDRVEAEQRLKAVGRDGCFLIRDSGSNSGVYILCLLHKMTVFQYRILTDKRKKMYVESTSNNAVRTCSTIGELIEQYLSKLSHNGLKTALIRGVRPDGTESSDDESEDETYVDHKYIKGRDDIDLPPPLVTRNSTASHIYSEPDITTNLTSTADTMSNKIHSFYSEQMQKTDQSRVSGEFVKKIQHYVDQNLVLDCLDMHKEDSRLSSNHLTRLKHLIDDETNTMKRQLTELLQKVDYVRDVLAKPGAELTKRKAAHIESESSFNTLVGLLSTAKQELCTLEMETVNSYNQMSGYANIDPLAIKSKSKTKNPIAVFEVRVVNKAILGVGGNPSLTLEVDISEGFLYIVKESSSHKLDDTNKFSADKISQVIKSTKNTRILEIVIEGRRKEGFYFDDIRQREHFCQLIQQMKKVHSQQAEVDSLSVFCGTWNMGNELPPQLGLQNWLKSQGRGKTRVEALSSVPHDVYAVGTQEAKVSERDWVNKVKRLLHNMFKIDFHLVDVCTLWQIRVVIFIKPEYKNRISNIQQGVVRTGVANVIGNKGASTISFNFDGTSLCFLCCHLAANRERTARRNQNSRDILKNLPNSVGSKTYSDFDITNQFNHVFWFGDLNYRVDEDHNKVLKLAADEKYDEMLGLDQLIKTINECKAFYGYDEECITFPPTYRYHKNSADSFDYKKMKKSGPKYNAPSWCDRVIWKSYPNCPITNTSYGVVRDVMTSDHKPVFASFTVSILPQNINTSVHTITTPIEIKLSELNCELMTEHTGDKAATYHIIIMGKCLEAPCESQEVNCENVSASWSETLILRPSFSDATYLATQHILIAVKSNDGMVIGDGVLALDPIFQDHLTCQFVCELTNLGAKTGVISGKMRAGYRGVAGGTPISSGRKCSSGSGNVVVNDIYAAPLSELTWEDYSDIPTISIPTPDIPDNMPRIKTRPKSFMAKNSRGTSPAAPKRTQPPLPAIYDTPPVFADEAELHQYDSPQSLLYDTPSSRTYDIPPVAKSVSKKKAETPNGDNHSEYYNTTPSLHPHSTANKAEYYNVDIHLSKPKLVEPTSDGSIKPVSKINPVFQSGQEQYDDETYEEAELVRPPPRDPSTHGRSAAIKPRNPGINTERSPQPKPRKKKLQAGQESFDFACPDNQQQQPITQGTSTAASWLLTISMSQYVDVFTRNNWTTMNDVAHLTRELLHNAGVKTTHIFRILDAIKKIAVS